LLPLLNRPAKIFRIGLLLLLFACSTAPAPIQEADRQPKNDPYAQKEFDCAIYTAAFSSDMRYIASGGKGICVWEIETGRLVKTFVAQPVNEAKSVEAVSVAFGPDHKTIAAGLRDGTIRLWDLGSGKQVQVLKGHTSGLRAIRYSSDGRYIASGGKDTVLRLWNAQTGEQIRTFEGHQGLIESVRFSPDNKLIVSAAYDGTVRLWDIETGKQVGESNVLLSASTIRFAGFSRNGDKVYIAALDGSAGVWDITTKQETKIADKRKERWGFAADLSPNGNMIVAGSDHGIIGLQSSETWKDLKEFRDGDAMVRGIAFAPDGKHFATVGYEDILRLWDVEKSKPVRIFKNQ
jgi:WD40 repeat protein